MKAGYLSGFIVGGLLGAAVMFVAWPYIKPGLNKAVHNSREFIDDTMHKSRDFIDSQLEKLEQ